MKACLCVLDHHQRGLHPLQWDTDDVCAWLARTDSADLETIFRQKKIDGKTLFLLTDEHLKEIAHLVCELYIRFSADQLRQTIGQRAQLLSSITLMKRKVLISF
jgi:hypothetical protein